MGALYLNRWVRPDAVPDATLAAVASIQLQKGHQQASLIPSIRSDAPLWWEWHGSPYLGAAHGAMGEHARFFMKRLLVCMLLCGFSDTPNLFSAGILYVLLNLPSRVLDSIPHAKYHIAKTLEYILSLECDASGARGKGGHYPTRMGPLTDREPLVHWCHGAPGAVFLFGKAHAVLGGPQHLPAALRAGEAIWECGLLRKGPGACHGVAGNAYAFLYLYQITGDEQWRHRAAQFALFMESSEFQRGSRVPDHPFSLFEGWAAAACLYADLMHPEGAAFPLFGLPAVP